MGIFIVGGSLMLLVKWPPGPANLDWGVWILAYFGYAYVIAAALYYAKTDKWIFPLSTSSSSACTSF